MKHVFQQSNESIERVSYLTRFIAPELLADRGARHKSRSRVGNSRRRRQQSKYDEKERDKLIHG